jgi:hypothetical protein
MGGMRCIGGFCEHSPVVHELVAKFADIAAKETAKEHGWQLKETTSYQRHRIRQRLATGAWRDFHENKIARLPYVRGWLAGAPWRAIGLDNNSETMFCASKEVLVNVLKEHARRCCWIVLREKIVTLLIMAIE